MILMVLTTLNDGEQNKQTYAVDHPDAAVMMILEKTVIVVLQGAG